jgi:hypothetical protein
MARNNLTNHYSAYNAMPKALSPQFGVGLVLMLTLSMTGQQLRADDILDWNRDRVLPLGLDLGLPSMDSAPAQPRPDRIRLFRIVPGFLSDPVGLEDDSPTDPDLLPTKPDDGPSWLQLAIGNDNPYFDVHHAGDPGGIGYTRVQSQLQLVDRPTTGCTFDLQAVTPAGAQQGGIEDGPTVVSPGFSLFHALDDGTAFQGFVSKDLHVTSPANLSDTLAHPNQLNRSLQYGLAVQRPVLPEVNNVYLFVEALGRYHYDTIATSTLPPAAMEVLPGMHLKLSDSWWLSGGVILPVNQNRTIDAHLWQITCSFHF